MSSEPAQLGTEIAIVGMSLRTPGARNPDQFWRLLRDGREVLRRYTEEELRKAGVPESLIRDPRYVPAGARLDAVDEFDAGFFGFNPEDAAMTDPQHRHFLECAWEALEHAGHPPSRFPGAVGVFAGCGMNSYLIFNLLANAELLASKGLFQLRHTGNDHDFMPTSVSYRLNLRGPSVAVQTACSSSLVAVHIGVQSLLSGECDMALVGGSQVVVPHGHGYIYRPNVNLSPDGRCFAFDERGSGTVATSGIAVLVLRRLDDAIKDGDCIHAVIRGSAVNNDGAGKAGFFAPGVDGHARAITEALAVAELRADDVTYMEVPGMGTPIGDPLIIAALTKAFRRTTQRSGYCRIGSTEPAVGHMDIASGAAALIKAVLAIENRQIPPSLNFDRSNPAIDFPGTPFVVNTKLVDWDTGGIPRRAGVSAVGIGGTNAHVIVEQAPAAGPTDPAERVELLVMSAKSATALDAITKALADRLEADPALNLADVAFTLREGRDAFEFRRIITAAGIPDAVDCLRGGEPARTWSDRAPAQETGVLFVCPGAILSAGAVASLAGAFPVVRRLLEQAAPPARDILGADVLGPIAAGQSSTPVDERASAVIHVAAQIALAGLFQGWGVRPRAVAGSGLGEYAAAHLAGVMPLRTALALASGAPAAALDASTLKAPALPLFSSVSGDRIVDALARDLSFWIRDLKETAPAAGALNAAVAAAKHPALALGASPIGAMTIPSLAPSPEERDPGASVLAALGRLWAGGAAVDWTSLRQGRRRRRVPLPTYPFERQRYWIDAPDASSKTGASARHAGTDGMVKATRLVWRPVPLTPAPPPPTPAKRPWLIFQDAAGVGKRLAARLRARGETVITVREDRSFYRLSADDLAIMPEGDPGAYERLVADIAARDVLPGRIVHLWLLATDKTARSAMSSFHWNQQWGVFSLFYLSRALAARGMMENLRIDVVSTGMQAVAGERAAHPEKATSLGPVRVLPREFPGLSCRSIDVEMPDAAPRRRERAALDLLADRLLAELDRHDHAAALAYRGGARYEQVVESVPLPAPHRPSDPGPWRRRGVYFITGGLGGIGLLMAEHLAHAVGARLVLMSRTALPPRAEWDAWLAAAAARDKTSQVLRRLIAIEESGGEVLVTSGDVANIESVRSAIDAARERFGVINGVLHLAGAIDEELVISKEPEAVERVLTPKVYGTLILADQFRNSGLDHFVLFSSISSVVGPPGHFDYAAANSFLDAFAASPAAQGLGDMVCINWGGWRDVGMSAGLTRGEQQQARSHGESYDAGLAPHDAIDALERAMNTPGGSGLIFSAIDIPGLLAHLDSPAAAPAHAPRKSPTGDGAPRDELEQRVVDLWRRVISIDRVGIHDDFFELGGHSLNAVRIFAELRRDFHVNFPLSTLFEAPTVALLSDAIRAETGNHADQSPRRPQRIRPSFRYLVAANESDASDAPALFLAAGVYGNVLNLRRIAMHLGRSQPVYGVQARGLIDDDQPHESFEEMARDYIEEIRQVQPHGPYLLGGYSAGGIVMLEAAQQLIDAGERVALLVMLDAGAPSMPVTTRQDRMRLHLWRLRKQGPTYAMLRLQQVGARLFRQLRQVVAPPTEAPLTPAEVRSQLVRRAYLGALARYRPRAYPGVISVLRANTEPLIAASNQRLMSQEGYYVDPLSFWGPYAAGVAAQVLPGDHLSILVEPHVRVLAERLRVMIADALADASDSSPREELDGVAAT